MVSPLDIVGGSPSWVPHAQREDVSEVLSEMADGMRNRSMTAEGMALAFIRDAIVQGLYPPGHRLKTEVIAEMLGISRLPLRDALRGLEAEGLVRTNGRRGAHVSVLGAAEIAEIYELRAVLETHLLGLAMVNLDDELLDRLQVVADEHAAASAAATIGARTDFYQLLYERADRPRAVALVMMLRRSIGPYLLHRLGGPHGHRELLALLRCRDVEGATGWLRSHLAQVSQALQEIAAPQSEGDSREPEDTHAAGQQAP